MVRESVLQGCNSLHPRSVDSLPLVEGDGSLGVKRLGPLGKEGLENGEAPHRLIHGANNRINTGNIVSNSNTCFVCTTESPILDTSI